MINIFILHLLMTAVLSSFFGITFPHVLISALLSWAILGIVAPIFDESRYPKRLWAFFHFLITQLWGIIRACFLLAFQILFKSNALNSLVIEIDTKTYTVEEVILASYAINLSPGTSVVHWDPKKNTLSIHVLDTPNEAHAKKDIALTVFNPILRFTR